MADWTNEQIAAARAVICGSWVARLPDVAQEARHPETGWLDALEQAREWMTRYAERLTARVAELERKTGGG